ncbi:MAG: hypothetical protein KGH87_02325, partial [Thaumarchaeota archaeon]|nr:hypothetical protein [Nitrososphaerota archaeon]
GWKGTVTVPASAGNTINVNDGTNALSTAFTITTPVIDAAVPTSGPVGQSISINFNHLFANHAYTIKFGSTTASGAFATGTTNSTGGAAGTVLVPSITAGSQPLSVTDGTNSPSTAFTVTSSVSLSPTSGSIGTSVTVSGSGFAASSTVTIKYAGTTVTTSPATVTTDSSGNIPSGVTFTVPLSAAGAHTVQATDASSNTASATFTVTNVSTQGTTSTTTSSGGASADQTGTTGIKVTISGSSAGDGTPTTIITSDLISPFAGVGTSGLPNPKYFDVHVSGIADGTANICITVASGTPTTMQYWSGASYTSASSITVTGSTICGNIPVSALTGTNVAVGTLSAAGGHGGSAPGAAPSFTTGFSASETPLSIDGTGFNLNNYSDTGTTVTLHTRKPFVLKMLLYGSQGASDVQHVSIFTNLRDKAREVQNSDTVISWDKSQPLSISDPHHYFGNVTVSTTQNGNKLEVDYTITFANPMAKSDIIIRAWSANLYSSDTYVLDAWQAVAGSTAPAMPSTPPTTTTHQPITSPPLPTTPQNEITPPESSSSDILSAIKDWGGYSSHPITNSELLQSMNIDDATYIPKWVDETAKWVADGSTSPQEFQAAISYLHQVHAIK